ncbi:hypothetical protein COU49_02610 [Candidatus Nomurabacteria bacterium CG10_big_fil_rev_8_21_14_0_10_35_16]|uniref:Uncharacterized protein n=1 Tax=Candidatus Nomurabacteria bacterium CG10_big_fil_rev_8_21_14_0_10_35_16 TaxID=1974731 RepID=A0A2H0TB11_9BACT|nr:MAG: hypothetical protein COU49_02610 [Candidatus Nomurabacteria bacterium CG10_big_fil_rev_8_21_14_0_10_35_16]
MTITILVAKILGIYLVISGLFIIVHGKTIPHLLQDFFDHPAIVYLTGVILIFLSSIYILQYNIWNGISQTIVTIFVWLVFLKGMVYIFSPKLLSEISIKKYRNSFGFYGFFAIIIGLFLLFFI